jgi:hypothetical protein
MTAANIGGKRAVGTRAPAIGKIVDFAVILEVRRLGMILETLNQVPIDPARFARADAMHDHHADVLIAYGIDTFRGFRTGAALRNLRTQTLGLRYATAIISNADRPNSIRG